MHVGLLSFLGSVRFHDIVVFLGVEVRLGFVRVLGFLVWRNVFWFGQVVSVVFLALAMLIVRPSVLGHVSWSGHVSWFLVSDDQTKKHDRTKKHDEPRNMTNPRNIRNPRTMTDPRNMTSPRNMTTPRNTTNPRNIPNEETPTITIYPVPFWFLAIADRSIKTCAPN